jgi:RNA polymerase sigma-70 factor, ECF subfamily
MKDSASWINLPRIDRMERMDQSDFNLVEAVGAGDHQAYEFLVRKYQKPVFSFVYRVLGDRHAAEDVLQEAFWALYRAAPRFEAQAQVSTWLFKIAYNLSLNEIKRRKRFLNLHDALRAYPRSESDASALSALEASELEEEVMTALNLLPENQKAALLLRVTEELTYAEIGEILSVSISSVESLIFRARSRLRQFLKKQRKE